MSNEEIEWSDFYIKIDIEPYGTVELLGLVLKDMDWLNDAQTKALPARTFTVHLIQSHLVTPTLDIETVSAWSDDLLSSVVTHWLKEQQQQNESALLPVLSFEEFKQAIYAYNDEMSKYGGKLLGSFLPTYQQLTTNFLNLSSIASAFNGLNSIGSQFAQLNNFATGISGITRGLTGLGSLYRDIVGSTQVLSNAITSFAQMPSLNFTLPLIEAQQFFTGLPDFMEWERLLTEAQKSGLAFDEAGYGFTSHLISFRSIRRFASINPQVRSAVITNKMASETRTKEFEERLHRLFQESSVLRRRWKIVAQALDAHKRRDYYVSVPALLAQIEGVIGDALILKKLVYRDDNKLYLKENGKPKLNRKGDQIEANGLASLIQHSKWRNHPILQGTAEFITSKLAGERNGILHGRKTDYGTAQLSVQGLLLLLVLATVFVEFETGRT